MHCFDTVLESGLDSLDTLLNALSFLRDLTQGSEDLSWHGKVVHLGVVWSSALSVMLVDERGHELNELFEVSLEFYEFITNRWEVGFWLPSYCSGVSDLDGLIRGRGIVLWRFHRRV